MVNNAGVNALTREGAVELAPFGIRANDGAGSLAAECISDTLQVAVEPRHRRDHIAVEHSVLALAKREPCQVR